MTQPRAGSIHDAHHLSQRLLQGQQPQMTGRGFQFDAPRGLFEDLGDEISIVFSQDHALARGPLRRDLIPSFRVNQLEHVVLGGRFDDVS